MAVNWQRGVLKALRVKNHPIEVLGVADLTPWYRRLRVSAPGFLEGLPLHPTIWVRLWVPSLKRELVVQRGYTIVDPDPASGEFSLDFVLHEPEGAAANWARSATIGSTAEIAFTPQRLSIDPGIRTVVLAGDATAVPAIGSILQSLPASTTAHVVIQERHSDRTALPLSVAGGTTVDWLDPTPDGVGVVAAVRERASDAESLYLWAAGERRLVKAVRELARGSMGLPRDREHSQYYWIEGRDFG